MSYTSVSQECPTRVSYKSVLQECLTRVSNNVWPFFSYASVHSGSWVPLEMFETFVFLGLQAGT